jgi:predicted lipoprotein with Yx(FWY)xxD motif
LLGIGSIHLDLYVTGYRSIPTIGNLFLLQVVSALGLGLLVLATGRPLVAAGGAGLAFGTLAGYLVSLHQSLFGFREVRTTAGIWAGVLEVIAFATLSALALSHRSSSSATASRPSVPHLGRAASRLAGAFAAGATMLLAVLLGVSLATALTAATYGKGKAPTTLDVGTIGGAQRIVTNSKGYTLYWFGLDTATTSACYSTCEAYWHPVVGTPVAGPGLTGALGTIRRTDGSVQVTYEGHPLYTYVGDSGPGQNHGNGVTLNGGSWYQMAAGT